MPGERGPTATFHTPPSESDLMTDRRRTGRDRAVTDHGLSQNRS